MLGVGGEIPASEVVEDLIEERRRILRERDRLSLRASALAGELSRTEYADEFAVVTTADWMRHEFKLGYKAAADLVRVTTGRFTRAAGSCSSIPTATSRWSGHRSTSLHRHARRLARNHRPE